MRRMGDTSYLVPLAIGAVYGLDELGIVQVDKVGTDANYRSELLMQLLDAGVILSTTHKSEAP